MSSYTGGFSMILALLAAIITVPLGSGWMFASILSGFLRKARCFVSLID